MAKTTVRFYGGAGNPLGKPHGAIVEHTVTVEHYDDTDNWDRDRTVLRAIARKLTGKRAAELAATFTFRFSQLLPDKEPPTWLSTLPARTLPPANGKRQTLERQVIRTWKQRAPKPLDDLARHVRGIPRWKPGGFFMPGTRCTPV